MSAAKAKGDVGERAVARLLTDLLGRPITRALGLGRHDDRGDLVGYPATVQVRTYADVTRAIREGITDVRVQHERTSNHHAAVVVRTRAHGWLVVLEPEHYARLVIDAGQV